MSTPRNDEQTLLQLTRQLLNAIASKDWSTYQQLTDPALTCFEPEACGHLVQGLSFHHFYFQLGGGSRPGNTTMVAPHVHLLGDTAVVSYVRLIQSSGDDGPLTSAYEETRVWHRQQAMWKQVHFHRSKSGPPHK
jgi:ketosteroid isomerase-like protein